jgi:hypothetical protein
MPIIALQRASQSGEPAGILFVNTDQIITIETDQKATLLTLGSGQRWVLDKPEDIASKVK